MILRALILSLLSLSAQFTLAESTDRNNNPLMRTCRLNGGTSWVVNLHDDQVLLCKFDDSALGSLDLLLYKTDEGASQSITNLLEGVTDLQVCEEVVQTTDLDGTELELCVFSDRSVVLTQTLLDGLNHPNNEKLRQALNLE